MICVNCNRKGHTASECRQPRVERKDRKCSICDKPENEAKACPNRALAAPRPVKAIEDAGRRRAPSVFCVTEKPKSQKAQFGDFIGGPDRRSASTNRVQPLSVGIWQDIAAEVKSTEKIVPQIFLHFALRLLPKVCRLRREARGRLVDLSIRHRLRLKLEFPCFLPVGFSHHDDRYLSAKTICGKDFVVRARSGDGGVKSSIAVV